MGMNELNLGEKMASANIGLAAMKVLEAEGSINLEDAEVDSLADLFARFVVREVFLGTTKGAEGTKGSEGR